MTMTKLPISEMRESAARLPLTMSMPLSKAASAFEMENYKDTLTHLLDFFEMSVQWLNCYFLALACSLEDAGKTKGVARAVRMIDVKKTALVWRLCKRTVQSVARIVAAVGPGASSCAYTF